MMMNIQFRLNRQTHVCIVWRIVVYTLYLFAWLYVCVCASGVCWLFKIDMCLVLLISFHILWNTFFSCHHTIQSFWYVLYQWRNNHKKIYVYSIPRYYKSFSSPFKRINHINGSHINTHKHSRERERQVQMSLHKPIMCSLIRSRRSTYHLLFCVRNGSKIGLNCMHAWVCRC